MLLSMHVNICDIVFIVEHVVLFSKTVDRFTLDAEKEREREKPFWLKPRVVQRGVASLPLLLLSLLASRSTPPPAGDLSLCSV